MKANNYHLNDEEPRRKESRSLSDQPHRVEGLNYMQSPTIYIVSLIVAFFFYHLDKSGSFGRGWQQTKDCYGDTSGYLDKQIDMIQKEYLDSASWIPRGDNLMILVGTTLLLSALTFVKQLQLRSLRARIQKQKELEEQQKREEEEAAEDMQSEENFAHQSGSEMPMSSRGGL